MPVILNETKQAENILEKGEVGNKPASTLFLLGKYYRQKQELNKDQTMDKLHEFMEHNYKNYNAALWEDIIEDIAKKSHKYPLREIDAISITQTELDKIAELQNIKYQKLLFTMLCYAKLYDTLSANNNGWVNTGIPELYRIANITVKYKKDKFLYLNDIAETGLISFSSRNDNLNIQLTFLDSFSPAVMRINDFRELGYAYLNYISVEKFIHCKSCYRLVKKTNNKCLYCSDCAKRRKNEQNKIYYQNRCRKIENS